MLLYQINLLKYNNNGVMAVNGLNTLRKMKAVLACNIYLHCSKVYRLEISGILFKLTRFSGDFQGHIACFFLNDFINK